MPSGSTQAATFSSSMSHKGIDVAAKAEIHQLIRNFAAQEGKAAIVISSEVNELVSVSDRIIVMSKGR